jgi:glucose dehydrogenase
VTGSGRRSAAAGFSLLLAAGPAVSGCGGGSSGTAAAACSATTGKAVTASSPVAPAGQPAAGWTLPGADLANTRDVASAITSSNVSKLGVGWTVPLRTSTAHSDGAYATTPVIVNGVVYVQDLQSNVMAISLATGRVLWTHAYNSPNGGPDGVNVVGGVVYGATNHAALTKTPARSNGTPRSRPRRTAPPR